jgi:actin beta/gamma 1
MNQVDQSIVLDNGSGSCKIGFAGYNEPSAIFSNIIGKPKHDLIMINFDKKDYYVGTHAQQFRGILKLNYPMENGLITNWDDMEKIWNYAFYDELRIAPSEHNIFLTEPPLNPSKNKEKIAQIMFESFNFKSIYITLQSILSLYASGRTSGLVFDSGDGISCAVPVYEGFIFPHAISKINLAGRHLTSYMTQLLTKKSYYFNTSAEKEIVRNIKEKLCYVSNININKENIISSKYELPDGQIITIGNEKCECSELLFDPILCGYEYEGIHKIIFSSINKCDIDVKKTMYKNIVLAGGTTMMPGLETRLEKEINLLKKNESIKIKIICPINRQYSVWLGGSIIASLPSFEKMWITKKEYDEYGSNIIHKKC